MLGGRRATNKQPTTPISWNCKHVKDTHVPIPPSKPRSSAPVRSWHGCCTNERLCCRSSAFKINQFCRPSSVSPLLCSSPTALRYRPTTRRRAIVVYVGVSSFEVERPPSVSLHRSSFVRSLTFISSRPPILRSLPLHRNTLESFSPPPNHANSLCL